MSAAPAPAPAAAPITIDSLIERTGREFGPDICLKVDTAVKTLIDNGVITAQSNITEVLNVIAYFCNTTRDNNSINTDDSIDLSQSGSHVDNTGQYTEPNTGDGAHADSLWKNDTGGAPTSQMIDINTLKTSAGFAANHIPVGILMRNGNVAAGRLKNTNIAIDTERAIAAAAAAGPIPDGVLKNVFINCIKQMINILEQTRTIFGPKGWANLYRKMNGGGGANKNHIKRTHRQHRRRYSSKQY
jgi:hypothetical protein